MTAEPPEKCSSPPCSEVRGHLPARFAQVSERHGLPFSFFERSKP